jgi:8-oxo-dGTP pyrophosphatase MutT (NUDIX family)
MANPGKFIIRVYGLVINNDNEILLTDEYRFDMRMTKFPGGGLHYGESTVDCLKREFMEECNGQEIENIRHFYTTDFFQEALLFDNHQLISIYYLADLQKPVRFEVSEKPFDFKKTEEGSQCFRWVKINEINEDDISFPIDKFVIKKLKAAYFENC